MAAIEIVILLIVAASVAIAILASVHVFRAKEPPGRTVAQLLFTWLVPIVGPLVTIQMHRRDADRHRLSETDDPGEVPGNISHRSAASRQRNERPESEPTPEPD